MRNKIKQLKKCLSQAKSVVIGPIEKASQSVLGLKKDVTAMLDRFGVVCFNHASRPFLSNSPVEDETFISECKKLRSLGKFKQLSKIFNGIVAEDLEIICRCDFVIAVLSDSPSCGTWHEIFLAKTIGKPVFFIVQDGNIELVPFWLFGCFSFEHFFLSINSLEKHLKSIHAGKFDPTFLRLVVHR